MKNLEFQKLELERFRVEEELKLRRMEIVLREKELSIEKEELDQKKNKGFLDQLTSPVGVAVIVALIGLLGTAVSGFVNSYQEKKKQQSDLVLKMIEISDQRKLASNLLFLEKSGYISFSKDYIKYLRNVAGLKENENIPLPVIGNASELIGKHYPGHLYEYLDNAKVSNIGHGHPLTSGEKRSGFLSIGGQLINFSNGITEKQAEDLLTQDMEQCSKDVDSLIKIHLSVNQHNAIVSFAYEVGLGVLHGKILRYINNNQLDSVPDAMMKWVKIHRDGKVMDDETLIKWRMDEAELWKRE